MRSSKKDIERKIELINKALNTAGEEKKELFTLLTKFSNKLSHIEEKLAKLEATLIGFGDQEKAMEKQSKNGFTFLIVFCLIIGGAFLYKEHQKNNSGIKSWFNSN